MKRGYSKLSYTFLQPPQSEFTHNPANDFLDNRRSRANVNQTLEVDDQYSDHQTLEEGEISPRMEAQPLETPSVQMKAGKQCLLQIESNSKAPSLDEVEDIIRYKFKNKRLLENAFTHSSFTCGYSYERLEFVGDSVLGTLFARELYSLYPDLAPGKLTLLRAANVDTEKLARVALRHGLHRYIRHNKPYLANQIQEFSRAVLEYPLHSNGLIDAPKDLADIVESTIGAVFMDCNSIDVVWDVFKGLLEPIITPQTIQTHPNTQLLEMCQKYRHSLKYVDSWEKNYSVECVIDGKIVGRGTYSVRKDVAVSRAAKDALDNKWKWMEDNGVIAQSEAIEGPSEPVIVKNIHMENSDEDANSSVEQAEELSDSSPGKKDMEEDSVAPPRGKLELHSINSSGIGDEFRGLSRGQRKRLRKIEQKILANTTLITPETNTLKRRKISNP